MQTMAVPLPDLEVQCPLREALLAAMTRVANVGDSR
jgi:hypothetical protein